MYKVAPIDGIESIGVVSATKQPPVDRIQLAPYTIACILTATPRYNRASIVNSLLRVLDGRLGSDLPEGRLRQSRSRRPGAAAPSRRQSLARSSILFDASGKSAPPLEVVFGSELLSDNLGRHNPRLQSQRERKSLAACA